MGVLGLRFCVRAFSSCGKRGPLFIAMRGPLTVAASLVAEHRLQTRRLSNCGSRAQLLRGMWDLPRPGLEPVSPELTGRFSTTEPPGNPLFPLFQAWNPAETFCGVDRISYQDLCLRTRGWSPTHMQRFGGVLQELASPGVGPKQPPWHHLETCQKHRLSASNPDLFNQNLLFIRSPGDSQAHSSLRSPFWRTQWRARGILSSWGGKRAEYGPQVKWLNSKINLWLKPRLRPIIIIIECLGYKNKFGILPQFK